MFSPGGIASLITLHKPVWQARPVAAPGARRMRLRVPPGGACWPGFFALIEMIYHFESQRRSANKAFSFFGVELDPSQAASWIGTLVVFAVGVALFYGASKLVRRAWENLTPELQKAGAV